MSIQILSAARIYGRTPVRTATAAGPEASPAAPAPAAGAPRKAPGGGGGGRLRRRLGRLRGAPQEAPRRCSLVARQGAYPRLPRLRHVGAARVELLVPRDQVRRVPLEPLEEDLAHLAAQVERDARHVHRARVVRQLEYLVDLVGAVVDPRHERRDEDPA